MLKVLRQPGIKLGRQTVPSEVVQRILSRIQERLGWRAQVGLDAGLAEMLGAGGRAAA